MLQKMMLRKMQKVCSRVLLGYPQAALLGTIPGAVFGTLVCWSSTAMEAQAGFLNLEAVPIGNFLTDGVALFQHTNNKHKNPDAFSTTQNDANQNQSEGADHIDITMLQLFTSTSASLTSIADLTTANMIYDLDKPNNDFTLRVDGSVGTGGADMYFFVPNGLFGSNEAINVYLFYQYTNFNDGTEAWTLDKNSTYVNPSGGGEVPEPTTLALWTLGGSLALLRRSRRKRTATLKMM